MLDFADIIAINKFDKRGAADALRDVRKQYQRNHLLFDKPIEEMPVFGTIASQFNDPGTTSITKLSISSMSALIIGLPGDNLRTGDSEKVYIIPPY
jgi:methylmalonyl-CoA mutase